MNKEKKLLNITMICIIFYILYKTYLFNIINILKQIFIPLIISIFIMYLLKPLKNIFNKKLNNFFSSLLSLIIFILIFYLIFKLLGPIFYKEVLNIYFIYEDKISFFNLFNKNILNIFNYINNIIDIFYNIIIIFIFSFILLLKENNINNFLNKYKILFNINKDFESYIKSLEVISFIEIIEYTLFYLIIGHPYFYLVGLLSGISNIIPYIGSFFISGIALLLSGSKTVFIKSAIGILIIPLIDNYIIDPKIFSNKFNISFLSFFIIIFISKILFGFSGIIFSMPIYIIIKNIFINK